MQKVITTLRSDIALLDAELEKMEKQQDGVELQLRLRTQYIESLEKEKTEIRQALDSAWAENSQMEVQLRDTRTALAASRKECENSKTVNKALGESYGDATDRCYRLEVTTNELRETTRVLKLSHVQLESQVSSLNLALQVQRAKLVGRTTLEQQQDEELNQLPQEGIQPQAS